MLQVRLFNAPAAAGCIVLARFQRYVPWSKREPFSLAFHFWNFIWGANILFYNRNSTLLDSE
jgi:hypothetical protein